MKKEAVSYFLCFLNQSVEMILPAKGLLTESQVKKVRRLINTLDVTFPAVKVDSFKMKREMALNSYKTHSKGQMIGGEINEMDVQ